jgi:hypothetical protein
MGSCVIGAPCDSCAISPDHTKYVPCTDVRCPAGPHPGSRQQDVVSDNASCFALDRCASVGVVTR